MQSALAEFHGIVIQPTGYLNAPEADSFRAQLANGLVSAGHQALLVDLSAVESLDSAGLMALVSALRLAQERQQRFALCSVSPHIRIIFELTQLDQVFEIFETPAAFQAAIARA